MPKSLRNRLAGWQINRLIGVEAPSVADVNDLPKAHQVLFHGNVLIVEVLTRLKDLTQPTVDFIALPLQRQKRLDVPSALLL